MASGSFSFSCYFEALFEHCISTTLSIEEGQFFLQQREAFRDFFCIIFLAQFDASANVIATFSGSS
jgi:hypothetical protein